MGRFIIKVIGLVINLVFGLVFISCDSSVISLVISLVIGLVFISRELFLIGLVIILWSVLSLFLVIYAWLAKWLVMKIIIIIISNFTYHGP